LAIISSIWPVKALIPHLCGLPGHCGRSQARGVDHHDDGVQDGREVDLLARGQAMNQARNAMAAEQSDQNEERKRPKQKFQGLILRESHPNLFRF